MTSEQLKAIGLALFGGRWQTELAEAMGVSRQMIVLWSKNQCKISLERSEQIKDLMKAKQKAINSLLKEIA